MQSLIDVFRMKEVEASTRIAIIEKLGDAIDRQLGMNITDDLVCELVKELKRQIKLEEDLERSINDL